MDSEKCDDCGRRPVAKLELYDDVKRKYVWVPYCKRCALKRMAHMGG